MPNATVHVTIRLISSSNASALRGAVRIAARAPPPIQIRQSGPSVTAVSALAANHCAQKVQYSSKPPSPVARTMAPPNAETAGLAPTAIST